MVAEPWPDQLARLEAAEVAASDEGRLASAAVQPTYFLGVWPGKGAGHHCYVPGGRSAWEAYQRKPPRSPWADPTGSDPLGDGTPTAAAWGPEPKRYDPRPTDVRQPEGVARVLHRDGWTLLTCWDRSEDDRGGCHSSFAVRAHLEADLALRFFRERFPQVWRRIDAHLGRAVRVELAP